MRRLCTVGAKSLLWTFILIMSLGIGTAKAEWGYPEPELAEDSLASDFLTEDDLFDLERFDQAMDAWLASQSEPFEDLLIPVGNSTRLVIKVNRNPRVQKMDVILDGRKKYTWLVTTGRPGKETNSGTFGVHFTDARYLTKTRYNGRRVVLPYGIYFESTRGLLIHGTSGSVGPDKPIRSRSHGCVRLEMGNAKTLFDLVKRVGKRAVRIEISGPKT